VATRWVKVLDQTRCIGCHACTTACKSENEVPIGVTRTYVKSVDIGTFPSVRRAFQVTRCNQCERAPCVTACPTRAMYRRADGIVDFDKRLCIGCKACIAACPYDAIFINPEDLSAEKCNFCAHRLDIGLEPACVVVCPTEAISVGDLNDPGSKVARIVGGEQTQVRRPEVGTRPGVFYKGAGPATLEPLAARRPDGGMYAWAVQPEHNPHQVVSGHRGGAGSSAAVLLSYDVAHQVPWGWRVSLYTWTKGIAAGSFLAMVLVIVAGRLSWNDPVARFGVPAVALAFLGVTGALLVSDLTHPSRFYLLFTRAQPRSWLVKGALIVLAYGAAVSGYLAAAAVGSTFAQEILAGVAAALALGAACYTAFLFAQAKGRDLWQSRLLAPQLACQAVLAGSAFLLLVVFAFGPASPRKALELLVTGSAAVHLSLVLVETTRRHGGEHVRAAIGEMTRGRLAHWFWPGVAAVAVALAAPLLGVVAVPFALGGLLAHEHAYVQAGQCVPLA
jgi:Fe-S-cluster-containing dehydrogenase component/formate-dependent nitrite reductase membrane component NrfD